MVNPYSFDAFVAPHFICNDGRIVLSQTDSDFSEPFAF